MLKNKIIILNSKNVGDFFSKIRTWEPGPVLGNLDLNRSLVWNPYSGTWTRTREPGPVLVYILKFPSTGDNKKHPIFGGDIWSRTG